MDAARGPGDYHGTMRESELEREAGGNVFGAREGTETRHQVRRLRKSPSFSSTLSFI